MKKNTIILDTKIDIEKLNKDLNTAIYMLHYIEDIFSPEEVKEVCFSLKNINDKLRKKGENKKD